MLLIIICILCLWLLGYICHNRLARNMNKHIILVYSSIIYFFFIIIYAYNNIDECRQQVTTLNFETMILLVFMTFVIFINNLTYAYLL